MVICFKNFWHIYFHFFISKVHLRLIFLKYLFFIEVGSKVHWRPKRPFSCWFTSVKVNCCWLTERHFAKSTNCQPLTRRWIKVLQICWFFFRLDSTAAKAGVKLTNRRTVEKITRCWRENHRVQHTARLHWLQSVANNRKQQERKKEIKIGKNFKKKRIREESDRMVKNAKTGGFQ